MFFNLFEQHTDYEQYKQSDEYIKPNMSYCENQDEIHFNKRPNVNGHEYVDLGLPSKTLWAKCNVGANSEEDYGKYFAWGETTGYTVEQVGVDKNFAWSDYKFGVSTNLTKYNETDAKTILDLEDDAAHVNMGGDWVIPTSEQFDELRTYTTYSFSENYQNSGINGTLLTSKIDNTKTLFIPVSGYAIDGTITHISGNYSFLLTNSITTDIRIFKAYGFHQGGRPYPAEGYNRDRGFCVRGVINY